MFRTLWRRLIGIPKAIGNRISNIYGRIFGPKPLDKRPGYEGGYGELGSPSVHPKAQAENGPLVAMAGLEILLTTKADQLNLLGRVFRPIFCGRVMEIGVDYVTLFPVIIKMNTAPFHRFVTPLTIPISRIASFEPFDCATNFPIP